jgi:hypothetical protein
MKSALAFVLLAATTASISCGGGAAFVPASKPPVVTCIPPNMLVGGACTAPTPAPTASLSVNPGTISKGESTTLTWQTSNATDVSIDGVAVQPNGSESVTPADSTTYTLTAKGAGGTQKATATNNLVKAVQCICVSVAEILNRPVVPKRRPSSAPIAIH